MTVQVVLHTFTLSSRDYPCIVTFTHKHTLSRTHSHTHTHHKPSSCSPKSDTCKVCDSTRVQVEAESDSTKKDNLNAEWDLHKIRAEAGYHSLSEDAAYSKVQSDTEMLTFDLEKSLPTPVLSTGIVYYKRQLWTYNQGLFY